MAWTLAACMFVAQLLCCILVEGKLRKYLPTLIAGLILCLTVLGGSLGIIGFIVLLAELKVLVMGLLAIGIYRIALWTKK